MRYQNVVAIDGPSGSGKSTLAKLLAEHLKLTYIDTGAMYRALGLTAYQRKVKFDDEKAIDKLLKTITLEYAPQENILISVDGLDLTHKVREHDVSYFASQISQKPLVREFLVEFQRDIVDQRVCVMEGRDIGTIVFPKAFIKFFVTASAETRAKRRRDQLVKLSDGEHHSLEKIMEDIKKRDEADRQRSVAPLIQAEDAILIDTEGKSLKDLVNELALQVQKKATLCHIKI